MRDVEDADRGGADRFGEIWGCKIGGMGSMGMNIEGEHGGERKKLHGIPGDTREIP